MQAHEVFQEGQLLLDRGDLQGGLSKIQAAASAVALPEYIDKAVEIRNDLATLDEIADVVHMSGSISPKKLAEVCQKLDRLSIKYGDIPRISRLRNRLEVILPNTLASLLEDINRQIRLAESASTLEAAKDAYAQSEQGLEVLQVLQPDHPNHRSLQADIQDARAELENLENSLDRAGKSVHQENRLFPRNAFLISKAVRKRFPHDPEVLALKRRLRWYHVSVYGGGAIVGILLILVLWFGGRGISGIIRPAARPYPISHRDSQHHACTITLTPTETATRSPHPQKLPFTRKPPHPSSREPSCETSSPASPAMKPSPPPVVSLKVRW